MNQNIFSIPRETHRKIGNRALMEINEVDVVAVLIGVHLIHEERILLCA